MWGGFAEELEFIHLPCRPGWQLVQPVLFLAHVQLLQRALASLHLQHGIIIII